MNMAADDSCHYDFRYLSHAFHLTPTRFSSKANIGTKLIQRKHKSSPQILTIIIHRVYENKNTVANSSGILESKSLDGFGNYS